MIVPPIKIEISNLLLRGDLERAMAIRMWERLLAIWQPVGEPTKAPDHEVMESIAALVTEWNGCRLHPLEVRDPVEPPASPPGDGTLTVAHERFFFDDADPEPPKPGTFSNVFDCNACEGNVAAGKSCHRCGRKGPLGQGVDWTAGIGRMGEIKAQAEALAASAVGPYQHVAVTTSWFREEVAAETSTRICPCGDRFTWSGLSADLEPWMAKHVHHAVVPVPLAEMRSLLAQAQRVAAALATQAELAADLRSDLQINLNRMPKP